MNSNLQVLSNPRPGMADEALELVAARFRALGEPIRLRILQKLESGPLSVTALTAAIGSSQPNISRHLRVLQQSGLVARVRRDDGVRYEIADEMVGELCDMVCSRLRERLEAQVGALGGAELPAPFNPIQARKGRRHE